AFNAQTLHPHFAEDVDRGAEGRSGQNRRIAELPAFRAWNRMEIRAHAKARLFVVSPPTRESGNFHVLRESFVHETPADAAGPPIEIFVAAPHGKIHVPVVEFQAQVPGRMRQVESDHTASSMSGLRDARDFKCLAGIVVDAAQHY